MRLVLLFCCTLLSVLSAPALRAAEWGDLTGQFVLSGAAPKPVPFAVPVGAVCGVGVVDDESLVVDPESKGIRNIVVYLYLKEGEKAPESHPDYEKTAQAFVLLDNDKCRFEPRVALLRTSQTLVVGNKDAAAHNTKIDCLENKPENPIIPAKASLALAFPMVERLPTNVSCTIHPWMAAKVLIRDNPYMAVTDAQGKFTIKNLPAGKHTFQFWHESMGFLAKELKQGGKPLTWSKGRTEFTIGAMPTDIGKVEVGVVGFKLPGK